MSTLIADKLKSRNTGTAVSVTDSLIIVGYGTITEDLAVEGNLNVTGDLVYDEATAVNLSISGIATVGSGVTISVAGVHASSGIVTAASLKYGSTDVETAIDAKASTGKAIAMAMVFG